MAEPEPTLRIGWMRVGAVYLVVLTVSAVGLRWLLTTSASMPPISPLLAVLLLLVAGLVLVLGLRVRRWVRRGDPIDGPGATRTLVLGQTAALAGGALGGYLTASLVVALVQTSAPGPAQVALGSALALGAAVTLTACGMLTQWCCQVPPEDDRPRSGGLRA